MTARTPISLKARAAAALVAAITFAGAFVAFDSLQSAARVPPAATASPPRLMEVLSAAKALKLITVEVRTTARAHLTDPSSLGAVDVSVEAPARLLFGCDLSSLSAERVGFSPVSSSYALTVPPPTRLATEVNTAEERVQTSTGWFRTQAQTEQLLHLARTQLQHEANELRESPEQHARILQDTRDQLVALVRTIAGNEARVDVRFLEPAPERRP